MQLPRTGEEKHLTLSRFACLLMDAGLLDACMDEPEVRACFVWSIATVPNEMKTDKCVLGRASVRLPEGCRHMRTCARRCPAR